MADIYGQPEHITIVMLRTSHCMFCTPNVGGHLRLSVKVERNDACCTLAAFLSTTASNCLLMTCWFLY